ncbi:MAG: TRAP transporter small permease subunit [Gammaproteobacteria bacterium]|nr:TRAP transporter small permease subunit [Gammaproteobacteria bacterium]
MNSDASSSRFSQLAGFYRRTLDAVAGFITVLTGVSLIVLTVIFGWLVFGRYVLNATPTWVEQVALLLVAYITFLGAATGINEDTHLSVSLFRDRCPRIVRIVCLVLSYTALGTFGAVMATAGYQLATFKWGTEIPLLGVPEGLRAVPLVICGVLTVAFSLSHIISVIGVPDGNPISRRPQR